MSPDDLTAYVSDPAAQGVITWARQMTAKAQPDGSEPAPPVPRLIIDEGRPNEIALDDHTVPLQRKQYELIRLLARTPGECVRYETIYDALWQGVCVEPSQMHYQKRTLLQRIREVCPGREKGLIQTRNRYGYALALLPESVQLRPARAATS
jgi:DNA-binding response OmpR family regulator